MRPQGPLREAPEAPRRRAGVPKEHPPPWGPPRRAPGGAKGRLLAFGWARRQPFAGGLQAGEHQK
jgi:hypothetical protein